MRSLGSIVAAVALAGTAAGCAQPGYYYSGYPQATYYPAGTTYYSHPATYSYPAYTYQTAYAYPQSSYGYHSVGDYYRNYKGIHPGPEYYP